jgi:AraC family transcriptional regulator
VETFVLESPDVAGPIAPRTLQELVPFTHTASSDALGWVGVDALRSWQAPSSRIDLPAFTHHALVLFNRPPAELDVCFADVSRCTAPAVGSMLILPAGTQANWRWRGMKDSLHVFLEPQRVARVAAEEFELDPARVEVPPLDAAELPQLRSAMLALNDELMNDGPGGKLAAESLANLLAVQLIRHVFSPRRDVDRGVRSDRGEGSLPRTKLAAVIDYIHANLHAGLSLDALAAVAHLSPYHFARQFKNSTGLPPHQYVIARRVDRAKQRLVARDEVSLAQIALDVGFSDQSQFSNNFRRCAGVTPRRFRDSARIA